MTLEIMEGRLIRLKNTLAGLEKSGIPLVGFDGTRFLSAEKGDDPALYYIVPKFMAWFGISSAAAVKLFLGLLLGIPFALGLAGIFLLIRNWKVRLAALPVYFLLFAVSFMAWDVYIALSASIVSTVPLFIYFWKRWGSNQALIGLSVIAGFSGSLFNSVRMHAGTSVFVFVALLIACDRKILFKKRALFLAALLAGWLIPQLMIHQVIQKRDAYLRDQGAHAALTSGGHVFWHSIYVGSSFLTNDYGVPRNDQEVKEKVWTVSPGAVVFSSEYDAIVKGMVLSLIKDHPYFLIRSMFAKVGVFILYALVFGNIGFYWALRRIQDTPLKLAFLGGGLFSMLAGLAVTPYHFYCLGFMTFIALFGILGISETVDKEADIFHF